MGRKVVGGARRGSRSASMTPAVWSIQLRMNADQSLRNSGLVYRGDVAGATIALCAPNVE